MAPPAGPEPAVLTVAPLPSRPPSGPINSFGSCHLPPVSVSQPFGSPQVREPRRLRANIRGRGSEGSGHASGSCHDKEAGRAPCTKGPAAHTRHVPVHTGRHTCTHACAHAGTPHTHEHVCAYTCSAHVGPHPASTRTCANTCKGKGVCTRAHCAGLQPRTHTGSHRHTCAHAAHTRTRTGDSTEWGGGSSWAHRAAFTICTARAAPEPSTHPPLRQTRRQHPSRRSGWGVDKVMPHRAWRRRWSWPAPGHSPPLPGVPTAGEGVDLAPINRRLSRPARKGGQRGGHLPGCQPQACPPCFPTRGPGRG